MNIKKAALMMSIYGDHPDKPAPSLSDDDMSKALDCLSDKERFVIEHRYGVGPQGNMGFDDIGRLLSGSISKKGVSLGAEQAYQVERSAFRKLKLTINKGLWRFK